MNRGYWLYHNSSLQSCWCDPQGRYGNTLFYILKITVLLRGAIRSNNFGSRTYVEL